MKNRALAIRAIKSDCKITGMHMDDEGKTCAIGMLALKAGVAPRAVRRAQGGIYGNPALHRAITKKFGLSIAAQSDIQYLNDRYATIVARRKAILNFIKTIDTDDL